MIKSRMIRIDNRSKKLRIFKMPYGWRIFIEDKFFNNVNHIELVKKGETKIK